MSEFAGSAGPGRSGVERARLLIEAGRAADALPLLHQAIGESPHDGEPRNLLAYAHYRQGNWRAALRAAEEAAVCDPHDEWCHRLRALALLELKQNGKALRAAEEASRIEPQGLYTLKILSRCQLANGKRREARESAMLLLQLAPDWADAHEMLGYVALVEKKWKEAEQHYRNALEIEPQSWSAMNDLALCLQQQRRHKEAVELFHQAARLNPGEHLARQNLFSSVQGYVGGGVLVLWLTLQAMRLLLGAIPEAPPGLRPWLWLTAGLVLTAAIGGPIWYRRRKLAEIHPTVVAFYQEEERRAQRRRWEKLGIVGGLSIGAFLSLFWCLTLLAPGSGTASLSLPATVMFALVTGCTLAGFVHVIRNRREISDRWKAD